MLFILEPKKITPLENQDYLGGGWNYVLDYSWILSNILDYKEKAIKLIFDVGCGRRSKLGKYIENLTGDEVVRIDRQPNIPGAVCVPDFTKYAPKYKPDIIYWASSIEHNTPEEMKKLYKHSIDLLNPGGLFLATIALSEKTFWQEKTKQTNLSISEAKETFDITEVYGNFNFSKKQYRENYHRLKDKYIKRFDKFDLNDPLYIVGGIKKIKGDL